MKSNLTVSVNSTANKLFNKDKIQLAFAPSSLILANYILPINEGVMHFRKLEKSVNPIYDTSNTFAKIIAGEAPCVKVYEDDLTLAFMDIMPQKDGHVLVVPKEQAVTIYDLSAEAAQACMLTVQKIGKALERAIVARFITKNDGR